MSTAGATSRRGKRRGSETASDMVISMLVVGGVTITVLVAGASRQLLFPHGENAQRVRVVDPSNEVAAARRLAPGAVLAPSGLPARWRVTSVRLNPHGQAVDLHLGYVTPTEKYAALEETTGEPEEFRTAILDKGSRATGAASIAGVRWEQRRTAKGETALVRASAGAIIIVTGSAAPAELQTLAASLR